MLILANLDLAATAFEDKPSKEGLKSLEKLCGEAREEAVKNQLILHTDLFLSEARGMLLNGTHGMPQ